MRVVEESADVLVVTETPWGFRAILLGVIFILACGLVQNWAEMHLVLRLFMGGFVALLSVIFCTVPLDVTARFERRSDRIEIVRRGFLGTKGETYSFRRFLRARVEESRDSDGSTYRLVLVFDPSLGEAPFTSYLSGGRRGPAAAAASINAWAGVPSA